MKQFLLFSLLLFLSGISYSYAQLQLSQLEKLKNVRYFAFTKDNPNQLFDIRNVSCSGSNLTTVFIVHGFFKISLLEPLRMKDDIFDFESDIQCVIVVSWLDYSTYSDKSGFENRSTNYHIIAKTHVRYLAQDINEKLQYIHTKGAKKIRLIGHSIGAHGVGQAARRFKESTGYEIDQIIALDPAGPFFKDNPHYRLQPTDAKNVTVFHTNDDRYGLGEEIGSNDIYVNGGKKQPECKRKLTDNICSHNRGWDVYSELLKNITNKRHISDRFVLCVDVSMSMDVNNRLVRAISAGTKLFSSMKIGSYIGIVAFSNEATVSHDIIKIVNDSDRESLISKLPNETVADTSIGAGLQLSMNILRNLPHSDQFCSTIILLSDGGQNHNLSPEEVLPELQKHCIGVNSLALGAEASGSLENISSQTGGNVIYVMENNNLQEIIDTERAFAFSYDNEMDTDIRPIYLPTKHTTLGNGESVIKFIIDNNIGKDTEFTFTSNDIKHFDVKLISPTGKVYTSSSPEYISDTSNSQKIYKIPFADAGHWNLVLNKVFKEKRSIRSTSNAIITVKTHQLDDEMPPIRLDAFVSKQTLEYPKSNEQSEVEKARILVYAELRRAQYPIINAKIIGHIDGLNEETITFHLRDDGSFPDELANDGVYTASINKLRQAQRYLVSVTATNENGTAKLLPQEIDYFERKYIDCDRVTCETLSDFEREAYVGSVKLISTDNEDQIPPNPITDLRATIHNETERTIVLEWTSPDDKVFDMRVKEYDIRAIDDQDTFETAFRFNNSQFIKDESNAEQKEKYLVRIPSHIWKYDKKFNEPGFFLKLTFAVKAIGTNAETSPRSNLASVVIKDRPVVLINTYRLCRTIRRKISGVGEIKITYC